MSSCQQSLRPPWLDETPSARRGPRDEPEIRACQRLAKRLLSFYSSSKSEPIGAVDHAVRLACSEKEDARPARVICELLYYACVEEGLVGREASLVDQVVGQRAEAYILDSSADILEFHILGAASGAGQRRVRG